MIFRINIYSFNNISMANPPNTDFSTLLTPSSDNSMETNFSDNTNKHIV